MAAVPLILVVDDDPDVCALLGRALGGEGYEVETALDGHVALAFCARRVPDLVLLDLMMPQMDGELFATALRVQLGDRTPPIVLLSASQIRDQVATAVGAAGMIEKPFDLDELRETVAQVCKPPPRTP